MMTRCRSELNEQTASADTDVTVCMSSHTLKVKVSVCRRYLFTSVSSTAGIAAISDDQSVSWLVTRQYEEVLTVTKC